MKETFETNLSSSQKEEMASQAAYEDLKAAKESEIKAGTDQKDTKTQELADTDEKLAQAKQDLEDTRNSLAADQKDTKTQELADTDSKNAQAKQDLEDTRNSLAADQKFLLNL